RTSPLPDPLPKGEGDAAKSFVMQTKPKQSFHFPRTTLVIEIDRRCVFPDCAARNQISLTKQEAIEYRGFDCFQCKRRNEDRVRRSELPDFWATAS
ncbi:MAG TPA: hypothetical protein VN956_22405, partial [Pyrinomonadaceae bacterium]|nr:hypothetical protein [Pyrinomonadaceae bacterium]